MTHSESLSSLMQAAAEVARAAGEVALSYFRSPRLQVKSKADGSPVTNADLASEEVAREWIRARFPADGILGEEAGEEQPKAARRWLLDPIDGTRTFVRGVPLWGTLVAIVEGDVVLAGAANFPALNELICAAPEEGCWANGERTAVSSIGRLSDALVLTTDETFSAFPARRRQWLNLEKQSGMCRSWGDCYGYLLVATGRAEAMVDPKLSEWDAAALLPIVEEAGGAFTDWDGHRRITGASAIATNRALAQTVRTALASPLSGGRE
ncbi:MAG TPA: histidinol-phosphatase [Gemmatimonadaceae bacterium]|nr:histidinol-phosphatase [Gemmatimonadaceae bacterium]